MLGRLDDSLDSLFLGGNITFGTAVKCGYVKTPGTGEGLGYLRDVDALVVLVYDWMSPELSKPATSLASETLGMLS